MVKYPLTMNRKIRNIVWYVFLACAALMFILSVIPPRWSCPAWLNWFTDNFFLASAAAVILLEAVAHVGWRPALIAWLMVSGIGGAAVWFGAPWLGWTFNGGQLFCLLQIMWCFVGGFYLVWHRVLPIFDARVVAFLTAISTLIMEWLMVHPASWNEHLAWLILTYFLARFIPLKGDSKPVSCYKPLTVILILFVAVLFLVERVITV